MAKRIVVEWPVGFFGSGRNFLSARFSTEDKMPVIVGGREPVTLSIAPRDNSHARIQAPTSPPWVPRLAIRFVPCRDRSRTGWAAGLLLRSRHVVTLTVRQPGEPDRTLRVGRV
jgi:hypothetical protein